MKKSLFALAAIVAVAFNALAAPVLTAIEPLRAGVVCAVKAAATRVHDAVFAYMARSGFVLAMTTLAVNKPRAYEIGAKNMLPVIASDIIYEGGAVGMVVGTGHARPLNSADVFVGFAERQADNSAGAAAAIYVELIKAGQIELAVTGAVITDVGQPVYATDDDTFTFLPTGGVFIGFVKRYVSAGVAVVEFNAGVLQDPYGNSPRETLTGTKTFDIEDSGKTFFATVDADADVLTCPAIAVFPGGIKIVNIAAFGTCAVVLDLDGADKFQGPDLGGADGATLTNTKATARRGDYVVLSSGDADGPIVTDKRGIWAAA
jgi:hypothetical protein